MVPENISNFTILKFTGWIKLITLNLDEVWNLNLFYRDGVEKVQCEVWLTYNNIKQRQEGSVSNSDFFYKTEGWRLKDRV